MVAPRSRGGNGSGWLWLRRGGHRFMCDGTAAKFWGKRESTVVELQRGAFYDKSIIKWCIDTSSIGCQGVLCTLKSRGHRSLHLDWIVLLVAGLRNNKPNKSRLFYKLEIRKMVKYLSRLRAQKRILIWVRRSTWAICSTWLST